MRLPKQTKADRLQLAIYSPADIAAIESFVGGLKAEGQALNKKQVVTVSGSIARLFWRAGTKDSPFTWDRRNLQFLRGRNVVTPPLVKAAADSVSKEARFRMFDAGLKFSQGKMDVAEWLTEHNRYIKILEGSETALGRGGLGEMTPADWQWAQGRTAKQYGFSYAFAEDTTRGLYGVPGAKDFKAEMFLNRTGMYANHGRCTYENSRKDDARDRLGHTHARRILAAVQHCDDCAEIAAQGWISIDEYPEIGSDACHSNCQCVTISARFEGDPE